MLVPSLRESAGADRMDEGAKSWMLLLVCFAQNVIAGAHRVIITFIAPTCDDLQQALVEFCQHGCRQPLRQQGVKGIVSFLPESQK